MCDALFLEKFFTLEGEESSFFLKKKNLKRGLRIFLNRCDS